MMNEKKVTIIGAGPIGSHAAKLLAEAGKEVVLIEEHAEIGLPVQCTGIVTGSIAQIVKPRKEFLVNRLKKVIVNAPDGSNAKMKIDDLVIDRSKFDLYLAKEAEKAGAKIILGSRAISLSDKGENILVKIKNRDTEKTISTNKLVGADGPNSTVSKFMENSKPQFWTGVQAVVNMPVDKNAYEVYFGNEFPGFFGWVVPENETTARVGIAADRNPRKVFDNFIKRFEKCKILEMQGGLIPKYNSKLTLQKKNLYLVGDAATHVKATTGGGIVPGMIAAECLANAIKKGTDYKKELSKIDRELKMSLLIRKMLDKFTDEDYNKLTNILDEQKIQKTLDSTDRDHPTELLFKLFINKPSLLLFSKVLLRAKRL